MGRISRGLGLMAAAALACTVAGPVAAVDPLPASFEVDVIVEGYTAGDAQLSGTFVCIDQPPPQIIPFGVAVSNGSGTSVGMAAPEGKSCSISQVYGEGAGDLGEWGSWEATPSGPQVIARGVNRFTITIDRYYNGGEPGWDSYAWFMPDLITVDRVYLNRTGGISAEGLVSCRTLALADVPGIQPIIGIDWTALQYVGRKTAIHGSYGSDIGKTCFDSDHPADPVRWSSMRMGPSDAVTAWVYGVDGRFASGTIIIAPDSYNDMSVVTSWWDPSRDDYDSHCSADLRADGWFDSNGDGFCAFQVEFGQSPMPTAVKTTAVKTR